MTVGTRLAAGALAFAVVGVALSTVILPSRVRFGPRSFACHSVAFPQPHDPIASALCDRAGAYRLRADVAIAALLAVLATVPLVVERTRPSARAYGLWAFGFVLVMVTTIGVLAAVGARHTTLVFVDR